MYISCQIPRKRGGLGHGHMYLEISGKYNWILIIVSTQTTIISHLIVMESPNSGSEKYDRASSSSESTRGEEHEDFGEIEDERVQKKKMPYRTSLILNFK